MATKKCPSCKKRVDVNASVCLYCGSELFSSNTENNISVTQQEEKHRGKGWLIVTCVSFAIILFLSVAILLFPPPMATDEPVVEQTTTTVTTGPTRDAARDAWLHTFTGRWYDENSVAKSDIESMGGCTLYIHDILNDQVLFDLYVYSGGQTPKTAFVKEVAATIIKDTLHFTFSNDSCNHSGEGHMRFTDEGIQMEVVLDDPVSEGEHSIALNAVFLRSSAPSSKGVDIRKFQILADVVGVVGRQTADPITDAHKNTTYTFGALVITTDASGALKQVIIDYSKTEDRTAFCFDQIDGTMGYETVKTYFGDAVHDYTEQPTNIRVLHYTFEDGKVVTFTFDVAKDQPTTIHYSF